MKDKLSLSFVLIILLSICNACNNNNDQEVIIEEETNAVTPDTEKDTSDFDYLGSTILVQLSENDGKATMGLMPHARFFYLDLNLEQSQLNLEKLKASREKDIPVRVYLFKGTDNVAFVEDATQQDIDRYEYSKIPSH